MVEAAMNVVNLLTLFSRSEELYEDDGDTFGLRPLALMLADAADARSAAERAQSLQRIGDVALFISGFFADSLAGKPVDIDYYIYMGGNAYGSLSEEVRGTFRGSTFAPIYRELAIKFQVLVECWSTYSMRFETRRDKNPMSICCGPTKSGSRRAAGVRKIYCGKTASCRFRMASREVDTDDFQVAAAPDRYLPGRCRL
jgi:hypothetical protein